MLHHFRQGTAAVNKFEPVVTAYSDITLKLPAAIADGKNDQLFIEHIQQISGLDNLYPTIPTIEQQDYQNTRTYAGMATKTAFDISVTMTQNLNNAHVNYIYNTLLNWYRLLYDERNAQRSLKVEYCSTGLITQYDRDDSIWRYISLDMCFVKDHPTGLDAINTVPDNSAANLVFNLVVDLATVKTRGIDF